MDDKKIWKKPKIKTLGSAQDLVNGLGGGKEPGPSDNQIVDVNIEFSWIRSISVEFRIFFSFKSL